LNQVVSISIVNFCLSELFLEEQKAIVDATALNYLIFLVKFNSSNKFTFFYNINFYLTYLASHLVLTFAAY